MEDDFKKVKSNLSITQLLHHYNVRKGRSKGQYYCPIHESDSGKKHKPSLVATDAKQTATCLSQGCLKNADIFAVIQKIENCNVHESLQKAAEIVGISLSKPLVKNTPKEKNKKKVSETKRIKGLHELQEKHLVWLENRGIDIFTASSFGLKAKDEYIAFPHWKNGNITGWKIRSIADKSKCYQLGAEEGTIDLSAKLWHLGVLEDLIITQLIFVEGEPDCLLLTSKFHEKGILETGVVTSTAGANTIPEEVEKIQQYFPSLTRILIIYDHDKAGKTGSKKLSASLIKTRIPIHIYSFPVDKKEGYDVTDFFNEGHTLDDLLALKTEIIAPYYNVTPPIEYFDNLYAESENIKTGFKTFDEECGGFYGLVVFGGETGIGKTTFMMNRAYHAAKNQHPVLYVSYELGYSELRVKLAAMAGKYGYSILNKERRLFLEARNALLKDPAMEYFKIIDTSLLSLDIEYIKNGITALKQEFPDSKIPLLVIDYLQGMPIQNSGEYRLNIASTIQSLRDLVRQENVVILVASATNTQRQGSNSMHAGVFRESSEIEYSAYQAIILGYKEDQKENGNVMPEEIAKPYLFVVKNRFGKKNTQGIPLKIHWEHQKYTEREGF